MILFNMFAFFFLSLFSCCSASGYFELQLLSVENIRGELSNGDCCAAGPRNARKCLTECATILRVCLKQYQSQVTFTDRCTFGNKTSGILGGNSFSYALNTTNSILKIPFEFSWTRSYTLIVTLLDRGERSGSQRIIERSAFSGVILPGNSWHTLTHHGPTAVMVYRIRVRCNEEFYNTTCTKFCRAHDDRLGHYTCNKNGDKVCMEGWLGTDCDFAICKTGCHALHGSCRKPGECRCAFGWEGELCDQCITYPGCHHGSCQDSPWTCNCHLNWGGILCDKDLNSCRLHPCKNNGMCMNIDPDSYKCLCPAGFTGQNCEIAENPCESSPCQHDSLCAEMSSGYVCHCMPGWTGQHCQTNIDDCRSKPCLHSGTCVDKVNGYECFCTQGWRGPQCQLDVDQCEGQPCVNARSCQDLIGDYRCECQRGWTGKTCDINIDDCIGQCENGGRCVDLTNDFFCICPPGFEGKTCQTEVKECDSTPCLNGATCIDKVPGYLCSCAEGYSGYNCQIDTDPCTPNPCYNDATCYVTDTDYFCYCSELYMGKNCEHDRIITINNIDSCTISIPTNNSIGGVRLISSGICGRHGLCISKPGGQFDCSCSVGYTGSYCHKNINDCSSQPCQNSGTCVDLVNSFQCICTEGWEGALCNINKNECKPNPCRNSGRCVDLVAGYFCECAEGWKGRTCILRDRQCDNFTCVNGGKCLDLGNTFSCSCQPEWEGNTCHLPTVRSCDSSPCENNSTCVNSGDSYTCMCAEGFEGPECQHNVDDCNPFPCYNGGRCIDGVNRFFCECVKGFSGPDCRVNINECLSSPCSYGSTCIDGIGEYKCICPPERGGDRCQKVKGQIPPPQSCLYKRRIYHHAVTWEDDCKRCECDDGTINCKQIPCGPENCAIKINVNTSLNQCKETETCVISKDQICFSPPCLPWGECKPKDAIVAKASAQKQQCIPNEPVFDPNCAKLTLKFEIPKVPLGVTVEEICSSIQTMPQLIGIDYDPKLLMITCTKSGLDEIQVFMYLEETKILRRREVELLVFVDTVVTALSQKQIKSSALQAVVELKVETALPSLDDEDPAYLIPLACSIIGLLGLIAILLLFLWHCQKKKVINKLKLAAEFAKDNTTNENKNNNKNLRRYRNPLYETDKGGGTHHMTHMAHHQIQPLEIRTGSSDRYERDSDKYMGSPTRLLAREHGSSNEWTDNVGSPCKTIKVKDINVELHKTRSRTRGRDYLQMMRDIDLEDNEAVV